MRYLIVVPGACDSPEGRPPPAAHAPDGTNAFDALAVLKCSYVHNSQLDTHPPLLVGHTYML